MTIQYRSDKLRHSGFTLVELSIVMIIIGLLIGGILKGQELIENSRINNLVSTVTSVKTAQNTFLDSYKDLPGDITSPEGKVAGCDAAKFCVSGNGNLKLGDYSGTEALGDKFFGITETVQYWKHLALADLIGGIVPGANPASPEWGVTHPALALGGGLEIFYNPRTLPGDSRPGHFLRYSNQGLSASLRDTAGQAAVTPRMAERIDRKMDDGQPLSGAVTVWDYGDFGCDNRADGSNGFDASISVKSCVMFFRM
ncbi:MAG: hypothetical protein DI586_10380 [Micavibrio aeruginosavorus]|uniref:Prepilin-type N-terminal cleavage/methylation domain-containing protein n=1 Tax=Micavibrio aeruginosavorus TaxID=349221 RepID=A0A2W5FD89_9BACT|nr:MAG: hypothetical protein DI586_10380 [Micavibrio aeruginosavorus]